MDAPRLTLCLLAALGLAATATATPGPQEIGRAHV